MTQSALAVLAACLASWAVGFSIGKVIGFLERLFNDAFH